MTIEEKIKTIETKKGMNHDLMVLRSLLDTHMPQHRSLHKIQVGGTNGKGSTVQWMNTMLQKMGYTTGVFTSPHLVTHLERIRINDANIPAEDWERIYDQYVDLFEKESFTMFEIDLWMALAYFIEVGVDIALMEVGMGGRLDATTALDYDIHLITNVGLDHQEMLGESLEQIAFEKSGMIKPGVVCLTTEKNVRAQKVMEQVTDWYSDEFHVFTPLGFVEFPYEIENGKIVFTWSDQTFTFDYPLYQLDNFALALEGLNQLGYPVNTGVVEYALKHFNWQGRYSVVRYNPEILVDGAHNVEGIQALVSSLSSYDGIIYFSALSDKNVRVMLQELRKLKAPIVLVDIHADRSYALDEFDEELIDIEEMYRRLEETETKSLVCGSLYFVGDVLNRFQSWIS